MRRLSFVGLLILSSMLACRTLSSPIAAEASAEPTEAATPTLTPVNIATPPGIPQANFSLDDADKVPPSDILDEVSYFGGGGYFSEYKCEPGAVAKFCAVDSEVLWLDTFSAVIEGVQKGEEIRVVVSLPDGRIIESSDTAKPAEENPDLAVFTFKLTVSPDMPLGEYQITFDNKSRHLEHHFSVIMPKEPAIHIFEDRIILLGCKPAEKVRFFVYEERVINRINLVGWKILEAGPDGTLIIMLPSDSQNRQYVYFVVTEKNEILQNPDLIGDPLYRSKNGLFKTNATPEPVQICPGLISRLSGALNAQVAKINNSRTNVRATPGFSQEIVGKVPEGAKVMLIGLNPVCQDNSTWWKVQTEDGLEGWMAESQNGAYLLEPAP